MGIMKKLLALALLGACSGAHADSTFPLMRDLAQGHELPLPYGVGVDFFTMDQKYDIKSLAFSLPGVSLSNPDVIDVDNEVWESDIKFDVWVLPFVNLFAIYGHIEGDTQVDLSRVPSTLPVPLGKLNVDYGGRVYGGGATFAAGWGNWAATLTGTYAKANLNGDFDSRVRTVTWQPRIGYIYGQWTFFGGGYYIDATEKHKGVFVFPGLGNVPFDVELESRDKFNYSAGLAYHLTPHLVTTLEFGGGDRTTTLFNFNWRF
jgi:hypothetical protein